LKTGKEILRLNKRKGFSGNKTVSYAQELKLAESCILQGKGMVFYKLRKKFKREDKQIFKRTRPEFFHDVISVKINLMD